MTAKRTASVPLQEPPQLSERTDLLLNRALELGSMPASTRTLLTLTRRENAEVGPVVDALALNPSLAATVLRVANSPAYGQARSIADLHRAVTVVGMQELHDLIASTAMMAAFGRPHPLSERLQATAVLSAALAQTLASKLHAGAVSTAYLAGLMCELGALACVALDPDYPALYEASHGDAQKRFEGEVERYGGTTPVIASRILSISMLPATVSQAVATTGFEAEADKSPLGTVVAFARVAAVVLMRAAEHGDPELLQNELAETAEMVGLPPVEPEKLTRYCLAAATNAELTLRGELGLQQTSPANDTSPLTGTKKSNRTEARWRSPYLVAGAVAASAALATMAWLLTR